MSLDRIEVKRGDSVWPFDRDPDAVLREVEHREAATNVAAILRRAGKSDRGHPQISPAANDAVAMLMQVTAGDQAHVGPMEPVKQPRSSRGDHAGWTPGIVIRTFNKERLVQEQGRGPLRNAQMFVEPLILPRCGRQG